MTLQWPERDAIITPYLPRKHGQWWEVLEDIHFGYVRVPKGYISDAASVPWWGEWLIPKSHSRYIIPCIIHDYCRSHAQEFNMSVRDTDDVFDLALKVSCSPWRRFIIIRAVRLNAKLGGLYEP